MMRDVLAIILGGGRGTRLYPLTRHRAKPAVPLAGKYRLIDIPLSNCINSDIKRIFVLTQFNSVSLNRHIIRTYQFSMFSHYFVEVLAAQQTRENTYWFQGTADAVRQHLPSFEATEANEYLILAGDQLYRMNYAELIEYHRQTDADITVPVCRVDEQQALHLGLVHIDHMGRIVAFKEKPTEESLPEMKVDPQLLGFASQPENHKHYIASMGIYVFKRNTLIDLLYQPAQHTDIGKEIIPYAVENLNIRAYLFNDYWEDIGTIPAFYQANLDLLPQPKPKFSFYDEKRPIYTRPRFLPSTKMLDAHIDTSMIAEGCLIEKATIRNSIIGIRSRIRANTVIENSLLMGSGTFHSFETNHKSSSIPVGVGENCHIKNAIIDKNVRIGKNVKILNKDNVIETFRERDGYCIKDGIVIIIENSTIPDNTII